MFSCPVRRCPSFSRQRSGSWALDSAGAGVVPGVVIDVLVPYGRQQLTAGKVQKYTLNLHPWQRCKLQLWQGFGGGWLGFFHRFHVMAFGSADLVVHEGAEGAGVDKTDLGRMVGRIEQVVHLLVVETVGVGKLQFNSNLESLIRRVGWQSLPAPCSFTDRKVPAPHLALPPAPNGT